MRTPTRRLDLDARRRPARRRARRGGLGAPAWPAAGAALPVGFAIAQASGVRPVGGAVMVALLGVGAWQARGRAGAARMSGVGAVAVAAFAASHVLHDALTVPGAVGLAGAVVGGAAYALLDRR